MEQGRPVANQPFIRFYVLAGKQLSELQPIKWFDEFIVAEMPARDDG